MVQDKERLLEWCRMRIEGYTLQEIADKYGVSREWVRASINLYVVREKKNSLPVYPNLYLWMKQKGWKQKELAEFLGISKRTIGHRLNGTWSFTYDQIEKLLQITGIPYETLFQREVQNEKTS